MQADSAQSVAQRVEGLSAGKRFLLTFPLEIATTDQIDSVASALQEDGFVRVVAQGRLHNLAHGEPLSDSGNDENHDRLPILVVVDRLTTGQSSLPRLVDSIETAMSRGDGRCVLLVECAGDETPPPDPTLTVDDRRWQVLAFSESLRCEACGIDFSPLEPRLLSFNSPLGACPECEGFGNIIDIDMDLVVPDTSKTIREGAIAPWNSPAYAHELQELLALAGDYQLPVDVPFRDLTPEQVQLIQEGVPERDFGGLRGFFQWLERRKYKMHLRVFLSRWRSYKPCPSCHGDRLRSEALSVQIAQKNIAEVSRMEIRHARQFFQNLQLPAWQQQIAGMILQQIDARLGYLEAVGLGYLTLDRTTRTLSGGEAQRVALTSALGSSLVNMLYVLDEPSVGLHPRDVGRLIDAICGLRDRLNTVVVVEHEEVAVTGRRSPDRDRTSGWRARRGSDVYRQCGGNARLARQPDG